MQKGFIKAIGEIKKQSEQKEKPAATVDQPAPKTVSKADDEDDLSSEEERKLKELGVYKKKIKKEDKSDLRKWNHDQYKPIAEKKTY